MPQRRHHDIRGNLYVKFDVAFPSDHFLEDEAKYKVIDWYFIIPWSGLIRHILEFPEISCRLLQIIESAFPPVRRTVHPPNCEEVITLILPLSFVSVLDFFLHSETAEVVPVAIFNLKFERVVL